MASLLFSPSLHSGLSNPSWTLHPPPPSDPSHHSAEPASSESLSFRRPLGVLEAKFDRAAQLDGQSDIFLRLDIAFEGHDSDLDEEFWRRVVLAWTKVRVAHPALESTIWDREEPREGLLGGREMRCAVGGDVVEEARKTFLVGQVGEEEGVVRDKVLNGERGLLKQEECLARLLGFRGAGKAVVVLVIAHVIADAISVFSLANELFSLIASPSLPTPSTTPAFPLLSDFLSGSRSPLPSWDLPATILSAWSLLPSTPSTLLPLLPLASESIYLATLPHAALLSPSSTSSEALPSERSRIARQRWFWAIARALLAVQHRKTPRTAQLPRIETSGPPGRPETRWEPSRFSKEETKAVMKLCRESRVSPSMLSYSILAIAVSNVLAKKDTPGDRDPYQPILFGFPISLRRFLTSSSPTAQFDLAIRITFGSIYLPRSAQFDNAAKLRFAAVHGARLATRQFRAKFDEEPGKRNQFLAATYYLIMDRLLTSHGLNASPLGEPKGVMNASMVGDLDRLLPTKFFTASGTVLRLSNALLGTRLHRGEGMLMEAFTWDGELTFCLGFDDSLVDYGLVREVLGTVREVTEVLLASGAVAAAA